MRYQMVELDELHPRTKQADRRLFHNSRLSKKDIIWEWYDDDEYVGYCAAQQLKTMLKLTAAYVDPKYRKRGVHRDMIELRLKFAHENKLKKVVTYTSIENWASMTNLVLEGFRAKGYLLRDKRYVVWHRQLGGENGGF